MQGMHSTPTGQIGMQNPLNNLNGELDEHSAHPDASHDIQFALHAVHTPLYNINPEIDEHPIQPEGS